MTVLIFYEYTASVTSVLRFKVLGPELCCSCLSIPHNRAYCLLKGKGKQRLPVHNPPRHCPRWKR